MKVPLAIIAFYLFTTPLVAGLVKIEYSGGTDRFDPPLIVLYTSSYRIDRNKSDKRHTHMISRELFYEYVELLLKHYGKPLDRIKPGLENFSGVQSYIKVENKDRRDMLQLYLHNERDLIKLLENMKKEMEKSTIKGSGQIAKILKHELSKRF